MAGKGDPRGVQRPRRGDDDNRSRTAGWELQKILPKGPEVNLRLQEHERAVRRVIVGELASNSQTRPSLMAHVEHDGAKG